MIAKAVDFLKASSSFSPFLVYRNPNGFTVSS
jgi:hypothetical protein